MFVGVLVGLLALGEGMPHEISMKLLRLSSWLVTMIGVSALANGRGKPFLHVVPIHSPSKDKQEFLGFLAFRHADTRKQHSLVGKDIWQSASYI